MLQSIDLYRPDGLAPAGVFYDHTLTQRLRVLVSYRYLQTSFDDLYVKLSAPGKLWPACRPHDTFVPTRMLQNQSGGAGWEYWTITDDVHLHGLGAVPAQSDRLRLGGGAALPPGFTNPGDIRLNGLYVLGRTTAPNSARERWIERSGRLARGCL